MYMRAAKSYCSFLLCANTMNVSHCCLFAEEVSERLLYLGNLPEDVKDEDIHALFPNARYVFVVRDTPSENGERKCKG